MTFEPKLETHTLFDSHKTFKIGGFYFLITISSISFKNWCSKKKKKNWCSTKPIFIYNANLLGVNFKQTFLSSSQSSLLSISPPHTASHIHLAPSTVFGHLKLNSIHPLPKSRSSHHVTLRFHQPQALWRPCSFLCIWLQISSCSSCGSGLGIYYVSL